MPVIFRFQGCRSFFFSNEGDPREPLHVHVRREARLAKFWLDPVVQLAESYGLSSRELNKLAKIIENRKTEIEVAWNEHFDS